MVIVLVWESKGYKSGNNHWPRFSFEECIQSMEEDLGIKLRVLDKEEDSEKVVKALLSVLI